MLKIGTFKRNSTTNEFAGDLVCVAGVATHLMFEPAHDDKGELFYRIFLCRAPHSPTTEVGNARPRYANEGKAVVFYSVRLNSPVFASTLYAKLYPVQASPQIYELLWEEPDCSNGRYRSYRAEDLH